MPYLIKYPWGLNQAVETLETGQVQTKGFQKSDKDLD